jgi:cysteine-rich repeat protein
MNCRLGPHCGDGIVQMDAGEQCDDGNHVNGDGCNADCKITIIH